MFLVKLASGIGMMFALMIKDPYVMAMNCTIYLCASIDNLKEKK